MKRERETASNIKPKDRTMKQKVAAIQEEVSSDTSNIVQPHIMLRVVQWLLYLAVELEVMGSTLAEAVSLVDEILFSEVMGSALV